MAGHAKTLNPRQRTFAQAVVDGRPLSLAYRSAGYTSTHTRAPAQIAHQPLVAAEIDRLRARATANLELSLARWQTELASAYEAIRAEKDWPNVLRSLESWGKHVGAFDQHDGNERAGEVLAALAAVGTAMLAEKRKPEAVEGRYSLLAPAAPVEPKRD